MLNKAIAISPHMPDFHDTRGTILMKLERPGDAVAAFENAIEAIARTMVQFHLNQPTINDWPRGIIWL